MQYHKNKHQEVKEEEEKEEDNILIVDDSVMLLRQKPLVKISQTQPKKRGRKKKNDIKPIQSNHLKKRQHFQMEKIDDIFLTRNEDGNMILSKEDIDSQISTTNACHNMSNPKFLEGEKVSKFGIRSENEEKERAFIIKNESRNEEEIERTKIIQYEKNDLDFDNYNIEDSKKLFEYVYLQEEKYRKKMQTLEITKSDIARLNEETYLNDTIITFYLK